MEPRPRWPANLTSLGALRGPACTLLLVAGFMAAPDVVRERFGDVVTVVLGLNTAYSALSGGFWPALATTTLSLGYFVHLSLAASTSTGLTLEQVVRLVTLAIAFPVGFLMVLESKTKAELAARLRAERDTARAYAHQLESEVERRLAELRQASAQQDELERFRELDRLKGQFVNAVSHELRTPLTSIVGYIEFMEDGIGGTLSAVQSDYVQQIRRSSRQLERLVDDLLDFARMEAGTFKLNLDLADLSAKIRHVADSLRPQVLDAKLHLEVEAPEGPLNALIDSQRIDQVLLNLLSNAIKFTPRDGVIRVRLSTEGAMARWEVEDTGIGICPSHHDKLFRPYSRIETGLGVKGTGLGLSISKAIIEAHGGEIGVESLPGKGSTFWFRLPLQPAGETARLSPRTR